MRTLATRRTQMRQIGYFPSGTGSPSGTAARPVRGLAMARRIRHPGLHDARGNELPHRLVEIAGVSAYVADAGDGPPILLIHGYGDTADGWRRVVPGLLKDHRVVALD